MSVYVCVCVCEVVGGTLVYLPFSVKQQSWFVIYDFPSVTFVE